MADVYVNALTTISTEPATTDSIVVVNRNTNEGQIIDYELLADKILDKLTAKTYNGLDTTSKLLVGAINELRTTEKRLIPVTAIPENANLNSYTTPGEYYCDDDDVAATITNSPVSAAFRLTVEYTKSASNTNCLRQTIQTYQKNLTYTRWTSDGTWQEWDTNDAIIPFQLGNAASYSFTMKNNFAIIAVQRDSNYQLLYLQYWWSAPVTVFTYGTTLLTVTKSANSYNVTITNTQASQTVGFIINPTADLRVS